MCITSSQSFCRAPIASTSLPFSSMETATIIGMNTVSIGTLSESLVHPREVFKGAILANAAGIIVVHNHPSGNAFASEADLSVTSTLKDAGRILGIPVEDHIIIGEEAFFSFRQHGLL